MTAESLSTVFAPNLLRSDNNDVGNFFSNMPACHRVTKILISHVCLFTVLLGLPETSN